MTGESTHSLSPSAEEAWQKILRIDSWANDFWLAFVFSDHTPSLVGLAERFAASRAVERLDAASFPTTSLAADAVVDALSRGRRVWLSVTRAPDGETWDAWWPQMLARLNETRQRMLDHPRGVVIAMRTAASGTRVAAVAPDLWSFRNLALTVEGDGGGPAPTASELLARADAARERGDLAAAAELQAHAVRMGAIEATPNDLLWERMTLSDDLRRLGKLEEAVDSARIAVNDARARRVRFGDRLDVVRDLSVALNRYGLALLTSGETDAAARAFEEDVAMLRSVVHRHGEHPDVLQELSTALGTLAEVRLLQENGAEAASLFEESVAALRVVVDRLGERPAVMMALGRALEGVGRALYAMGETEAAATRFEESLLHLRSARSVSGDDVATMRTLGVALNRLGAVRLEQGQVDIAESCFEEDLAIAREVRSQLGDRRDVLDDLTVALNRLAEVYRMQGNLGKAATLLEESLFLRRSTQPLSSEDSARDGHVSVILSNLARIRFEQGRLDEASRLLDEGVELVRANQQRVADRPEILWELVQALTLAGYVQFHAQDPRATETVEEAIRLADRLRREFPEAARHVDISAPERLLEQLNAAESASD